MPRTIHARSAHPPRARLLASVVAVAAIGLAACGGSSSPHVASLSTVAEASGTGSGNGGGSSATKGSGASSGTKLTKGNPTALVDEWATCMHSHGDPNQADPTIDAHGVINVTIPGGGLGAVQVSGAVHAGTDPCNHYMAAAQSALRAANPVAPPPDQAEQVKYVNCMRANGVPNYPYPTANMTFQGTGVDPNSPAVVRVNNVCGRELNFPAWWIAGTGPPGDVSVSSGGTVPNGGQPPPCFYATTGCPNGGPNRPRSGQGGSGAGGAPPVQPGG